MQQGLHGPTVITISGTVAIVAQCCHAGCRPARAVVFVCRRFFCVFLPFLQCCVCLIPGCSIAAAVGEAAVAESVTSSLLLYMCRHCCAIVRGGRCCSDCPAAVRVWQTPLWSGIMRCSQGRGAPCGVRCHCASHHRCQAIRASHHVRRDHLHRARRQRCRPAAHACGQTPAGGHAAPHRCARRANAQRHRAGGHHSNARALSGATYHRACMLHALCQPNYNRAWLQRVGNG